MLVSNPEAQPSVLIISLVIVSTALLALSGSDTVKNCSATYAIPGLYPPLLFMVIFKKDPSTALGMTIKFSIVLSQA